MMQQHNSQQQLQQQQHLNTMNSSDTGTDDNQVWIAQYTISTFFKSFTYQLRLNYHMRHDQQYARIIWDQIGEGPFVFNTGSWELFARDTGTEAHYTFNVGFKYYVPSLVKNWVLHTVMKDSMDAIKKRVQSLPATAPATFSTTEQQQPFTHP